MAKNSHQNLTITIAIFVYARLEPGSQKKAVFANISLLPLNVVYKFKVIPNLKIFSTFLRTM